MTTVAFKDGILAADSMITSEDTIISITEQKVFKTKKYLCAYCGELGIGQSFIEWVQNDFSKDYVPKNLSGEIKGDFTGIVIDKDSNIKIYQCDENGMNSFSYGKQKIGAWGNGASFALGAMYAGVGAKQAVQIAAQLDTHTGGLINTVMFDVKEKTKTIKKKK